MRLYPIVQETLSLARFVRTAPDGAALDAAQLRSLFRGALSRMRRRGEQLGVPARDLDDAGYALVALADECVLARGGTLASDWMREQLQLALFGENTAGEGFFVRLDAIRHDVSRADVLAVYYLVLALGFRGRYAASGDLVLDELLESLRLDLSRADILREEEMAPSGARPPDPLAARSDGRAVLAIGVGATLLAALFWGALFVDLSLRVAHAAALG